MPWPGPPVVEDASEAAGRRGEDGPLHVRGADVPLGAALLFVPDGSPLLVAHSIDAHAYRPPDVFLEALRACPPTRSIAYRRALLASGGRTLLRRR
ncbi:MAG TPA: hypothetical protein RMH85_01925 [Polyangiaceae bacterium LLY-WYZ-15_(1-7)]|nr:hypothetical protein [Myxococcales bacterium]MAT25674.1 hypothetical protein [Sandaracinus sp.]HJK89168.1 hypothetical protein [Polyangiaceae bacterium LLY-WYZ-15_(1-7)]MBJ74265.1 hypothetical protein [Sandaracinus sp.]HJL00244.1 hypothetical protein [Polyangiaceae bacterium LLY-WYZ-15_(1-7)]